MGSHLKYALTAHIMVYQEIPQMFWKNAILLRYEGRGQISIESVVLNQRILVTEDIIRTVLQLNDDNEVVMFRKARINETLEQKGYNPANPLGAITKNGFIKP
ncbi:hypothetical protein Hanom_Chr10g00896381 [Helianthus anomalus]